jgi:hypothetical protein
VIFLCHQCARIQLCTAVASISTCRRDRDQSVIVRLGHSHLVASGPICHSFAIREHWPSRFSANIAFPTLHARSFSVCGQSCARSLPYTLGCTFSNCSLYCYRLFNHSSYYLLLSYSLSYYFAFLYSLQASYYVGSSLLLMGLIPSTFVTSTSCKISLLLHY